MITAAVVCLALNVYHEARGEPIIGQEAVAMVTLNRAGSERYPNDICGVVKQQRGKTCQFSWWCDGKSDRPRDAVAWSIALEVAHNVLQGDYEVDLQGATHYHADYVSPYWANGKEPVAIIGKHIFYEGIK
jgi:spore germination cell wall hydrolase CwlJ-like protein